MQNMPNSIGFHRLGRNIIRIALRLIVPSSDLIWVWFFSIEFPTDWLDDKFVGNGDGGAGGRSGGGVGALPHSHVRSGCIQAIHKIHAIRIG